MRPHYGRSLCKLHWWRWYRWGDALVVKVIHALHGLSKMPEYEQYKNMKARCSNPGATAYAHYGGRSIVICERYRESFANFYEDLGPCPEGMRLDRKNPDGNYSCGRCAECIANSWTANCRWVTRSLQAYNKRLQSSNTSGYRGVHFDKANDKWRTAIQIEGVSMNLGRFNDIEQAALAYDCAAIQLYGDDAKLNILKLEPAQ